MNYGTWHIPYNNENEEAIRRLTEHFKMSDPKIQQAVPSRLDQYKQLQEKKQSSYKRKNFSTKELSQEHYEFLKSVETQSQTLEIISLVKEIQKNTPGSFQTMPPLILLFGKKQNKNTIDNWVVKK